MCAFCVLFEQLTECTQGISWRQERRSSTWVSDLQQASDKQDTLENKRWWREEDSNLRRHSQQIYHLHPLLLTQLTMCSTGLVPKNPELTYKLSPEWAASCQANQSTNSPRMNLGWNELRPVVRFSIALDVGSHTVGGLHSLIFNGCFVRVLHCSEKRVETPQRLRPARCFTGKGRKLYITAE